MTDPFKSFVVEPAEDDSDFEPYKWPDEELAEMVTVRCKVCKEDCAKSPQGEWVHKHTWESLVAEKGLMQHKADPDIIDVKEIE